MFAVAPIEPSDADSWLRMRCLLWPEGPAAEHRDEIDQFFAGRFRRSPWHVLVAKDPDGCALGFVEVSVRPYAEGCDSTQVAYLEGWYVDPGVRVRGVGRALVSAAEDWAREQGYSEFGSDADPDNATSIAAHRALGFQDAGTVRCFKKRL
jgi:aminoglycoside 6'-N-acetyltransferase I